jgi:hypothetical protein
VKRILHRIEVIKVSEVFVKAVHARQVLVEIAKMVLAELPCFIAHAFENGGNGHRML